jgi:hypothetical protein
LFTLDKPNPHLKLRISLQDHCQLWKGGVVEELSAAIRDGDEKTYAVLRPEKRESELTVGLEWPSSVRINGLRISFATLNEIAYEPLPDSNFGTENSGVA